MNKTWLKQKNIGSGWGGFKQTIGQLNMYFAFINLVLLAVTAWNTTISDWLIAAGISIPFWVFAVLIMVALLAALLFEHKVSIPSFFSYWNSQFWAHDNPLKKEIEDVNKRLDAIVKILNDKH